MVLDGGKMGPVGTRLRRGPHGEAMREGCTRRLRESPAAQSIAHPPWTLTQFHIRLTKLSNTITNESI